MIAQDLTGKVAIITGGGGGIGSATAERLARAGAAIAIVDINNATATDVAGRLKAKCLNAEAFIADVAEETQVHELVAAVVEAFGRVDILHNNAVNNAPEIFGHDQTHGLLDMTVGVWDATFAVNVRGPMLMSKHVIAQMLRQKTGGVIVNTSSLAWEYPNRGLTAYGASKGALNTLTSYIAAQFGAQNIRCNSLVCGMVVTDGLRHFFGKEQLDAMLANTTLRRATEPEDIAAMVHFLVSEDSRQMTGQLVKV
jgi:NAD(P)-dependent dehydrogenase (short-subunit alcohol dehydrogenase family)